MKKGIKTMTYDRDLQIETYHFEGIQQPFPNHFHEYYVIGLVEEGKRNLYCKNKEYAIGKGAILIFNPGDNHACTQSGGEAFSYCALNIAEDVMLSWAEEITGKRELPVFSQNVVYDEGIACQIRIFYGLLTSSAGKIEKEESWIFLLSGLLQMCGEPIQDEIQKRGREVERACTYIEHNFGTPITLEQLCRCAGLSKSALLRAFTKEKGITPYRYLENIRIGEAKKLLELGVTPAEAALRTGFSDQSHFSNYFNRFLGLTPGAYREIFQGKEEKNHGFGAEKMRDGD